MILLFQMAFVFGQNEWSNWSSMSCYQGFKTSANNLGIVESINQYAWKMKVKNTYNKKVHFNMNWIVGGEKQSIGRFSLNPGEETNHVSFYFKSNSSNWQVQVTEVCFGENWMSCSDGCHAECDNGTPKQPDCSNTSSTNSNNSSSNSSPSTTNNSTAEQNDLTEYNHSKADLERQIAEKNAEGQTKSQNYTTAMNAGIAAHNSGNYAEAKRQFSIALNNWNTEEARQKAQEHYDKTVSLEKNLEKIKATNDLVQVGIKAIYNIGDAIKANKERKEQKEAETKVWLEKKRQEKLAKEEEEKIKFEQLLKDAENGSFNAQYEIAKKYGEDDETYRSSLYFYKMAFKNPEQQLTEDFLVGYTDKLQDNGNIIELESIILDGRYTSKFPKIKLKGAFYRIFTNKYFGNYEDWFIQIGIDQLKELFNYDKYKIPETVYAYMQVAGGYEKFGIPMNEKEGLRVLENKTNRWANYYLGLLYLNGSNSIKKNEKKAKEYFRECAGIDKNYKKSDAYNYTLLRLKSNRNLSIYSPQVLSYIEFAKITEAENTEYGSSIPSQIFAKFPSYYTSFIPREEIDFVSKYVSNIHNMRQLNIFGLSNDKNERFGIPDIYDDNTIDLILVNYPLDWCKICFEQYQIIKRINNIRFYTIQVATSFDITKEQSNDTFYYEGGSRSIENGSIVTVTTRDKISNNTVFYTNKNDFDVTNINDDGSLPAIYFYNNNVLKHVQTGLTDEKTIIDIITKIK